MIRVTKIFTFETAHILYGYDGKCKNIHGHSYKLFVTIKGKPIDDINNEKNGMVLDFGDLKAIVKEEIVDEWDHGLMVNALSPHKDLGKELEQKGHKVIYCDYQPTCENMLYEIADKIKKNFDFIGVSVLGEDQDASNRMIGKMMTVQEFSEFTNNVDKTVNDLCARISEGDISIKPKITKEMSACTYCRFSRICMFDIAFSGCSYEKV